MIHYHKNSRGFAYKNCQTRQTESLPVIDALEICFLINLCFRDPYPHIAVVLDIKEKKDKRENKNCMKLLLLQLVALSTQLAPQEYLDRWARNLFIEYTVVNNLVRTTEFDFPANEDESAFEFRISITNTGVEELNLQPHWSIYFYHRNWSFSFLISIGEITNNRAFFLA